MRASPKWPYGSGTRELWQGCRSGTTTGKDHVRTASDRLPAQQHQVVAVYDFAPMFRVQLPGRAAEQVRELPRVVRDQAAGDGHPVRPDQLHRVAGAELTLH